MTGNGLPDIVIGQYTGGDHCCTVATILELATSKVSVLGRIDGLGGLPFEGLEIRSIHKDGAWDFVAHRPYVTNCGDHAEAADVLSIYSFANGKYIDATQEYGDYWTLTYGRTWRNGARSETLRWDFCNRQLLIWRNWAKKTKPSVSSP